MKSISSIATGALVGALVCCFTPAVAMDDHTVLKPNDVKWGPGPASIPKEHRQRPSTAMRPRKDCLPYGSSYRRGITYLRTRIRSPKS